MGLQPSVGSIQPPVGGSFGFLSEEIWQNDVRKLHFLAISAPFLEAVVSLLADFWNHPVLGCCCVFVGLEVS